jgi:hypothetical protein
MSGLRFYQFANASKRYANARIAARISVFELVDVDFLISKDGVWRTTRITVDELERLVVLLTARSRLSNGSFP